MGYYIDIEVDDFLDSCSEYEINEVIDWLDENGYIDKKKVVATDGNNAMGVLDYEWDTVITTLSEKRLSLTSNEEEIIKNIAKRFI
jgi:hypothetical protein